MGSDRVESSDNRLLALFAGDLPFPVFQLILRGTQVGPLPIGRRLLHSGQFS